MQLTLKSSLTARCHCNRLIAQGGMSRGELLSQAQPGLGGLMIATYLGSYLPRPEQARRRQCLRLPGWDSQAVASSQIWRLVTANTCSQSPQSHARPGDLPLFAPALETSWGANACSFLAAAAARPSAFRPSSASYPHGCSDRRWYGAWAAEATAVAGVRNRKQSCACFSCCP